MKHLTIVLATLVATTGLVTHMAGQAPAAQASQSQKRPAPSAPLPGEGTLSGDPIFLDATKPHDKQLTLDIVEVVGCLSNSPNSEFLLTNATVPVKGGTPSTTKEALNAAATEPLGTQKYVLIGASEWNPASHRGQKVAVKGLLIKDAKVTRVNVTSFQKVGDTCTK